MMAEYYEDFTMSMFANIEDLYKAKAEYYEKLARYLDGKISAASNCHPNAVQILLDEASSRAHFNK